MKLFKNVLHCIAMILVIAFCLKTYALDQMAKEEKTPPTEEGALTSDQIPAIYNMNMDSNSKNGENHSEQS